MEILVGSLRSRSTLNNPKRFSEPEEIWRANRRQEGLEPLLSRKQAKKAKTIWILAGKERPPFAV
ncbi:hypothetical protein N7499_009515 [Penicillium canescens]|uniref:Uncharacterized protein n=1 Tax=Penicillium canescens TaxID=5083 RepID=A0AAD6INX7_PENCN|nr:uncharacterized protein N7446_008460 [Penicillium canescens]KAJ6033249.1 hypothetical protein N7444_011020 [Penicillium canescens]KAJ6057561.1 hypothetical protein N7460_000835 [Penicillium canescens]KAJ6058877.1 hypothetical protein N7446_008460 [Penicillium canescens]KAJ6071501.1 hypothetical protein N7499_009515 [Penicillium canescens]KAJ6170181.1 hypothetical protein N7485_007527 [Penicillium canescens]